jgi:hypothetical protein
LPQDAEPPAAKHFEQKQNDGEGEEDGLPDVRTGGHELQISD